MLRTLLPRMQVATKGLVAISEPMIGSWELPAPQWRQVVGSPWEARQAIRDQVYFGADWIKIIAMVNYHFEPDGRAVGEPQFTFEELQAVVDEAGWEDRIGSIEKGKYADIIPVSRDPSKDITELER
jgi:imidazolonepropionase-like amidohydrolase